MKLAVAFLVRTRFFLASYRSHKDGIDTIQPRYRTESLRSLAGGGRRRGNESRETIDQDFLSAGDLDIFDAKKLRDSLEKWKYSMAKRSFFFGSLPCPPLSSRCRRRKE